MIQIDQIYRRKLVKQTKKIPNTSRLVKKTDYNAKISEIEGKIFTISAFATTTTTTTGLTAVENKTSNVIDLVKKN